MDKAARASRGGLALIAASVLAISAAFTWRDIRTDHLATEEANAQLTAALAASIEAHFDAALRDAGNAALSAALLVEKSGGASAFAGERALHDELYRELTDQRSTARLVLTDAGDRVLASSAEYAVPPLTVARPSRSWEASHPDGRSFWVHAQTTVIRDEQHRPSNLIVHVKDVTERKNAEQALRELNDDLERRVAARTAELSLANKDLEAFSYSAAHDLRAPLGRLTMFVDVLGSDLGQVDAKVARRLDSVQRQVRDMTALIDSLLALARTNRATLHPEVVDLGALTAAVITDLQTDAHDRAIEWRKGELHPVRADRALLRQALENLLGNAVKYTRGCRPAVIEISSEVNGDPAPRAPVAALPLVSAGAIPARP